VADTDIPPDVNPPTVTQTWGMYGPPMDGDPDTPSGPRFGHDVPPRQGAKAPPVVRSYVVSPGSIEGADSQLLTHTQNLVDSYTLLKDYIGSRKSWIFSVPNDHTIGESYGTEGQHLADPHPDWTQQMTAVSDNLLLQVADSLETTGQFIHALNTAGQFYVQADKNSEQPTLPVQLEPHSSSMEGKTSG
jgi:hypothetical protein